MKWQKISSREEKVGFKTVTYKTFKMPDGTRHEFTTWSHEGRQNVAVIALTSDKRVITAKQFRPGPEEIMYELPGGGVDDGEKLEDAARRELKEETGYESATGLVYLGKAYRDAYMNETGNYFIAYDCERTAAQELGANEYAEIELITIGELINKAKQAQLTDGVGVLMAYDKLHELQDA